MPFSNKLVLVTGGAGVLGRAVVAWFSERGARVAVLDYSEDILRQAFPEPAGNHSYLTCELTNKESCVKAVGDLMRQFDKVDVLANIAGGFLMGDPVHETSNETWDFLFDLNARSIMNMSTAVVPGMIQRSSGKIVNVAARAATAGVANMGAYTASKAAVMRLTEAMAMELREQNINVNAVMPSLIDTPRNREDMPDADFDKWVKPEQLAGIIGFLTSKESDAIHGACIPVDGLS
ncbi:MAG: SDR family NAD(P)-dependent oxidoreductase [Pseudomonadales bacterium]|nr:3-oxoacyl-ACP reductase [Gammaproteobacteria bacterium]MDP6024374.1 SDR family NAD(P)-dependent oxidoreductase [Pseudomonadales bacterium]MDP6316571.1 SDR family NAD(P)-dependent oxidoreductase [Pseudomonadales bacterium]MDP7315204.1 SDR family NAD(P)-dependent oxidoreductase [Pseudomonadales bacterium]MDP7577114.1 SDR family NAD(P)-dependent oxidoreductase [Pseudomonadales bacterium]